MRLESFAVATAQNAQSSSSAKVCHEVAVLIVAYRNPEDVSACLAALGSASPEPSFDVFICENGGRDAYEQLAQHLLTSQGPCDLLPPNAQFISTAPCDRFLEIGCLVLKARNSRVFLARARQNLGYAGAINGWLMRLLFVPGWDGVWILNPDTEPEPTALKELVERAKITKKGMVGSTIVPFHDRRHVACRGGLHWRKLMTEPAAIGFSEPLDAPPRPDMVETSMDCASGASMYVTRSCINQIGLMDERYFLYYEDLDWGLRAKACGLGYASASVVPHKLGTTTGSARKRAQRSQLSVYLATRNRIHFVRKHFPSQLPLTTVLSLLYTAEFLITFAPRNFLAALQGFAAALKGETGTPPASYTFGTVEHGRALKRILIIATQWWPPAARIARALKQVGFEVASVSPPGSILRKTRAASPHYNYRPWAAERSLERALKSFLPGIVVCADDQALTDLYELFVQTPKEDLATKRWLGDLIKASIGAPENFDVIRQRSQFMAYAQALGVRCPKTVIVDKVFSERELKNLRFPIVVKSDGSWGGLGVRLAQNRQEAQAAVAELARPRKRTGTGWRGVGDRLLPFGRVAFMPGAQVSLQEFVEGRPANRAVVCWKGEVLTGISVEALETLYRFGPASVIRLIHSPEMSETTALLVRRLQLSGFIGFDFILDEENRAWLIELNPRLTPTCHIAFSNTKNLAQALFARLSDGESAKEQSKVEETIPADSTVSLFPQELLRSGQSQFFAVGRHDVPWEEPELVRACLESVVGYGLLKRMRRRLQV